MSDETMEEIVAEFLSTAVIVDDRLQFDVATEEDAGTVDDPDRAEDALVPPDDFDIPVSGKPTGAAKAIPQKKLDAQKLTEGFVSRGLVCGVYRFEPEDATTEKRDRLLKSLSKADLLVMDWKLVDGEEDGNTSTSILKDLLVRDLTGSRRLRMCTIYSDVEAGKILPELQAALEKVVGVVLKLNSEEGTLCIETDKNELLWRIFVIDKEETIEEELAERIEKNFVEMVGGFVPGVVLAAASETRRKTYEHLFHFSRDLDRAAIDEFLVRTSDPCADERAEPDFGDFLTDMVTSSISDSIRGSALVAKASSKSRMLEILELDADLVIETGKIVEDRNKRPTTMAASNRAKALAYLREQTAEKASVLFKEGFPDGAVEPKNTGSNKKARVGIAAIPVDDHAALSQRSIINRFPRRIGDRLQLKLGTVLRTQDGDSDTFFVCVQPACDGVRLNPDTTTHPFPLLAFKKSDWKNFEIVSKIDNEWIYLRSDYKPKSVVIASFNADKATLDVRSTKDADGNDVFEDDNSQKFHFVDQLKSSAAQEIVSLLATQQARIGGNKHEFLRLGQK